LRDVLSDFDQFDEAIGAQFQIISVPEQMTK